MKNCRPAIGKAPNETTRVGCVTCHRGLPIPETLQQTLARAVTQKGLEGAIADYRALRTKYTGTMAYDLSENGLITMAQGAINGDRADNAIGWLNLNLEFYPKSSRTYQALAQAYQKRTTRTTQSRRSRKPWNSIRTTIRQSNNCNS